MAPPHPPVMRLPGVCHTKTMQQGSSRIYAALYRPSDLDDHPNAPEAHAKEKGRPSSWRSPPPPRHPIRTSPVAPLTERTEHRAPIQTRIAPDHDCKIHWCRPDTRRCVLIHARPCRRRGCSNCRMVCVHTYVNPRASAAPPAAGASAADVDLVSCEFAGHFV